MASFVSDNAAFEDWLRSQCQAVEADLKYKHECMKKNPFVFLRATYFRWAKCIEALCPELNDAPKVLSVGDSQVENFGTWHDAENRLVWGVNDFDEAATIAYPFDLVRLAASARLSPKIAIGSHDAAAAILAGYRAGLANPRPILLNQQEIWMRPYALCSDADRQKFWSELDRSPDAIPPTAVVHDFPSALPENALVSRFASRVKGTGSLGRPRYVAIATVSGERAASEAKALVTSAWDWAHGDASARSRFLDLATGKFRSPDPSLNVKDGFILRRISPDARKLELGDDAGAKLNEQLLQAMGFDLAAIHAAQPQAVAQIHTDLDKRKSEWLHDAAKTAAEAVQQDFTEWSRT